MAIDYQNMTRWAFDTRLTTHATATTLGAAAFHEFTVGGGALTIKAPVAAGRFSAAAGGRVLVRLTGHLSGAANTDLDGVRVGVKFNAGAYVNASDVTIGIANSASNWHFELTVDMTAEFAAGDPGTTTFTTQIRAAFATGVASSVGNLTAEIFLTYGGDSTVSGRVRTAVFPVQSHHSTPVSDGVSFTEIGTTGGTGNAPVNQLRQLTGSGGAFDGVTGFAVLRRYLIICAMVNKPSIAALNIRVRFDGGGAVTTFTVPAQPLATNHKLFLVIDTTALSTAAAHSLEIGTDTAGTMEHVGALDVVTHDYSELSLTQFVSAIIPLQNVGSDHANYISRFAAAADSDRLTGVLNIAEPSPVADQCGVVILDGMFSSGCDTVLAAPSQTARTYDRSTVSSRDSHGQIVHRLDHSGASLTLVEGLNHISVNSHMSAALATTGPACGYAIVNYRCDLSPSGEHGHTRTVHAAQVLPYAEGTQTTATPAAPVIPSTYLISGAMIESAEFCIPAGQDFTIAAQRLVSEDSGSGWYRDLQRGGSNIGELGTNTFYRNCTSWFKTRPVSLTGADVEATRKWQAASNAATVGRQATLVLTYHSITVPVSGSVTIDGDPAPNGTVVTVVAALETGLVAVGVAVTSAGSYTVDTPYPFAAHTAFCEISGRGGASTTDTPGLTHDIDIGSAGNGGGTLVSFTGTTDRWTPVVITFNLDASEDAFVVLTVGQNRFCIYDAADVVNGDPQTGFSGFFRERSSFDVDGGDVTMTLLPSGGWWTREFSIKVIAGQEIT